MIIGKSIEASKAYSREYMTKLRKTEEYKIYRKTYVAAYIKTEEGWRRRKLKDIKYRAKTFGIDFNLTLEDIYLPTVCPILDIPISLTGDRENLPSLDRIDNSKGYIKGNVHVISNRANRIKSDASFDELLKIAHYFIDYKENDQ